MGVDLSTLVSGEPKSVGDFMGRAIAIDAHNALYAC